MSECVCVHGRICEVALFKPGTCVTSRSVLFNYAVSLTARRVQQRVCYTSERKSGNELGRYIHSGVLLSLTLPLPQGTSYRGRELPRR